MTERDTTMDGLLMVLFIIALLAALGVLAQVLGVDSRDGIGDTHRPGTIGGI